MKFLIALVFVFGAVFCQSDETVTEGLLRSQEDLILGHTFFDINVIMSRETLSSFIYRDTRAFADSHLDAYAEIKQITIETREELDGIETTPETETCVASAITRWEIQIQRFGHRLSDCLKTVNRSKDCLLQYLSECLK